MTDGWRSFGLALGLSCALTPLCHRLALRLALVDRPNERKLQPEPVPLLGGVALLAAALIGAWMPGLALVRSWPGVAALGVAVATGLADDWRKDSFPLGWKVLGLLLASLLGALSLGSSAWCSGGLLLGAGWCFLVINAFNLSDNENGLCAGLAAVPWAALALAGGGALSAERGVLAGLAGAALGFLPFNFPRARVYLGDAGTFGIGTMLALTLDPSHLHGVALALVAIPLLDLVWVATYRTLSGIPPWRGDRRHLSHQLIARGTPPAIAVVLLWGIALAIAWLALRP